ncbi:MAG: hypothetical protein VKL39_15255, partial [Leptolyngbyaceae bacterium]|nr:hypothetical protein [Leptolyngbyaceae bacterium]
MLLLLDILRVQTSGSVLESPLAIAVANRHVSGLIVLAPLSAIAIVFGAIPFINQTARRYNRLDRPSARKVHQR